jgi:asparagine N-glycosylation enzyme membrane subunit Stt3
VGLRRLLSKIRTEEDKTLLWTIFVILLVLWLLGMVSSYTLGGYIHILLILAIAVVLIRVIQGRRPIA